MKRILISVFIVTCSLVGFAQQDPQFTMWQFDRLSVNPAMSGMDRMHCITAIHRDQWDGLAKDPKTYLFNYSGMFGEKQNLGFGSTVCSEVLGQQQNTVIRFSPSYHLALNDGSFFAAGASIGFYQAKLGHNWVFIDAGDPTIPSNTRSQGGADIGLGVNFYKPKILCWLVFYSSCRSQFGGCWNPDGKTLLRDGWIRGLRKFGHYY